MCVIVNVSKGLAPAGCELTTSGPRKIPKDTVHRLYPVLHTAIPTHSVIACLHSFNKFLERLGEQKEANRRIGHMHVRRQGIPR